MTDVGVLIAKSGGGAQGDNIRCYNCYFNGFTGAGWQVGGNNTGRNVGRFYAQNAIKEQIIGGDIQGCSLYGVAVYGGSIEVNGTTMENDSAGLCIQTGFDVYCEAPQDRCIVRSVRSESHKLAAGNPILVEHSLTDLSGYPVVLCRKRSKLVWCFVACRNDFLGHRTGRGWESTIKSKRAEGLADLD